MDAYGGSVMSNDEEGRLAKIAYEAGGYFFPWAEISEGQQMQMRLSVRAVLASLQAPCPGKARELREAIKDALRPILESYQVGPAVAALMPLISAQPVPGGEWVLVPQHALDWLNGLGDDFERPEGARGNFRWRTEFRRRCATSAPLDSQTSGGG